MLRGTIGAFHYGNSWNQTYPMKQKPADFPQVPVGIVVSVGKQPAEAPRFSAYIWGPAPKPEQDAVKAA